MNKLKIILTFIISIFLLLIFSNNIYAADDYLPDNYDEMNNEGLMNGFSKEDEQVCIDNINRFKEDNLGIDAIGQRLMIGNSTLRGTEEVYCAEHYKTLDTIRTFEVVQCLEIDGAVARIPGTETSRSDRVNVILGYMLSQGEMKYGLGYRDLNGNKVFPPQYSDTQLNLYMYLSDWLSYPSNGSIPNNVDYFDLPSSIIVTDDLRNEALDKLQEQNDWSDQEMAEWLAAWNTDSQKARAAVDAIINEINTAAANGTLDKYYRKLTIYFLEHEGKDEKQHIIIAIPEPDELEFTINKIDADTRLPLANAEFHVTNSKGEYITYNATTNAIEFTTDISKAKLFVTDSKGQVTITGIPEDIYTIIEVTPPAGYELDTTNKKNVVIKENDGTKTITFENKKGGGKQLIITKHWIDDSNKNGSRPSSITVEILQNGNTYKTVTISEDDRIDDNTWQIPVTVPDKDPQGNEYIYSIKEISVPGYRSGIPVEIKFNEEFSVTNTYNGGPGGNPGKNTDITVKKEWIDLDSSKRQEVTVHLIEDGQRVDSVILNDNNSWEHTFTDLPTTKQNIYVSVDKGQTYYINKISITLYADGDAVGTGTLTDINNWSCEFTRQLVYDTNGDEIDYTIGFSVDYSSLRPPDAFDDVERSDFNINKQTYEVEYDIEEDPVPGYTTSIDVNDDETEYIIENKEIGIGNVIISGKVWLDDSDGKGNNNDSLYDENSNDRTLEGILVYWKDENGNQIAQAKTDSEGKYMMQQEIDIYNHEYGVDRTKYNLLNNSYIEFEYNGLKYTTVAQKDSGENTSKAIESSISRKNLDDAFDEINNIGVLDTGNVYQTRYMGGNSANLQYDHDYANNRSTLKQEDADFPVTASTAQVLDGLLSDYSETDPKTSRYCIDHRSGYDADGEYYSYCAARAMKIDKWYINNVNLGLVLREQPDIAITSDIYKVRVIMKGQEYTYYYNSRGLTTAPSDELFDYTVKFSGKYTQEYKRPINPSDIAYINYDPANGEDLQVYVTYNITVKNQSSTLPVEVQEIVNYYDAKYDKNYADSLQNWSHESKYKDSYDDGTYRAVYNQELTGQKIDPGQTSKIVSIEHKVDSSIVQSLINGNDILIKNAFEIYAYSSYYSGSTNCAEEHTAIQIGKSGMQYAGVDLDSAPGSAKMQLLTDQNGKPYLDTQTFEDDTDMAPTFVLCKDPNYKIISGLVWEDSATEESEANDERLGNGKYDSGENLVEGAQVQLLKINDDGSTEPAYLYYLDGSSAKRSLAVTYTDTQGNYTFGEDTVSGVVVDNYVMRYTYGNGETELIDFDKDGGTPYNVSLNTKINDENGSPITGDEGNADNIINARNYKSTIITASPLKEVIKGSGYSIDANEWHINHTDTYSVAVDDIEERKTIPSLTYDSFDDKVNMSAFTAPFKVQIEYDTKSQESTLAQQTGNNGEINIGGLEYIGEGDITSGNLTSGTDYENNWRLFDFGIIERAREDIVVDKTIENIKITLANGQVLIEGNPYEDKLDYVKALGDSAIGENAREDAAKANAKFLSIEVDTETIQGARLDILYKITVTNNSEKDYEYEYDYGTNIEASSNIIKDNKAYYYYFGEVTTPLIKSTVEWLVDYVDPELTCTVGPGNIATEDVNGVNDDTYIFQENRDTTGTEKIIWMQVTPEVDASGNRTKTAAQRLVDGNLYLDADLNTSNGNEIFVSDDQLISTRTDTIDIINGTNTLDKLEEENYSIFITNYFYDVVSGTSKSLNLFASKLIANQADEYTYENHTEILQLNGKIARNIDSVNDGKQIDKYYKPGDYVPSLDRNGTVEWLKYMEGFHEFDDDMITIRITPPTGLESNAIIYISVGAVALIVLAIGIFIIKKKVLGK